MIACTVMVSFGPYLDFERAIVIMHPKKSTERRNLPYVLTTAVISANLIKSHRILIQKDITGNPCAAMADIKFLRMFGYGSVSCVYTRLS